MASDYTTNITVVDGGFDVDRPAGYNATFPSAGTWGPTSCLGWFAGWYDDAASLFAAPTGFTQPGGDAKRVGNHTNIIVGELAWRIAGASEPAIYDGGGTAAADYDEVLLIVMNGTDQSSPLDFVRGNSATSTTVTWTVNASPARNGSLGVACHFGFNNPAGAIGGTPTMTERINAMDGVNDLSTAPYNTSDTGNRTATKTSDTWVSLFAVFQPPAAGGSVSFVSATHYRRRINPGYHNMKRARSGLYVPARLAA